MASSSRANRTESGSSSKVRTWFKTTIFPNQEEIEVCPNWSMENASNINFHKYGFITNPEKIDTIFYFRYVNNRWCIISGEMIAARYGFRNPTTVILKYDGENKFFMVPTQRQNPVNVLPPAPATRFSPGSGMIRKSHFRTIIFPDQEIIGICHHFLNNFKRELNLKNPAWIIDNNERKVKVLFKWISEFVVYMSSGVKVSRKFGFTKPTSVYLHFEMKDNCFRMFLKPNQKEIFKHYNSAETRPIVLSSDSELDEVVNSDDQMDDDDDEESDAEVDDDFIIDRYYDFKVNVTAALAYTNQVLHFPHGTSRNVLQVDQKHIHIRDVDTGAVKKCEIITSNRSIFEKYLGEGWYDYKIQKRLMAGDVLQCSIEEPPEYMNVKVVRGASVR